MPKNMTIIHPKAVIAMPSRFVTSPTGALPYAVRPLPKARQTLMATAKANTLFSLYHRDTPRGRTMPQP